MGNPLLAIARALQGGAGGFTQGVQDFRREQQSREELGLRRQSLALQEALQRAQLAQSQNVFGETQRHNRTMEDQGQLQDLISNWHNLGIDFVNPEQARSQMTVSASPMAGAESPISTALSAADQYVQKQGSLTALSQNADKAGREATNANAPRAFVQGSEPFGGAFAQAKQFSPYSYLAASQRQDNSQDNAFYRAVSASRQRVESAYTNALRSYAAGKGISDITRLTSDPAMAGERAAAMTYARGEQQRAAQAEQQTLGAMFPERMTGITPEMLMGVGSASAPAGGGAPTPTGSSSSQSSSVRVTMPQSPRQLPLTFDPNDPLGIGTGGPTPVKAAPKSPTPNQSPRSSADPLGLFSQP